MDIVRAKTINEYVSVWPAPVQRVLEEIRELIRKAAPEAEECISYQMPTFRLEGNLVHFAANKNHLGFYPAPSGIRAFADRLEKFKTSKGAIQFPLDRPLPSKLISDIVKFRVQENLDKALKKKSKRKCKNGHVYYKSSDCPTCPVCETNRKPVSGFLSLLSAPARRALEDKGIVSQAALSQYTEREILALHGMGKATMPILKEALAAEGLKLKEQ